MSPERRREMVVRAALPLVAEHGAAVTTAQIARAAGVGEATVFREFADKAELPDARVAKALRPDHVLTEIAARAARPAPGRPAGRGRRWAMSHMDRIGSVLGALHAADHARPGRGATHTRTTWPSTSTRTRSTLYRHGCATWPSRYGSDPRDPANGRTDHPLCPRGLYFSARRATSTS
jgi:AcrR family transcriptional regulator